MLEIDHLPVKERVSLTSSEEASILACLNRHLAARNLMLEAASSYEDMVNKTDALLFRCDDKERKVRWRVAVKTRTEKNDILVAVRDPFYGEGHEKTKMGRDMKLKYVFYVTLNPGKTKLRVACGKKVHKVINDMMEELAANNYKFPLNSVKHPSCQLRKHVDRWNGNPKILGFIPPAYLKEGSEIVYYDYTE